MQKIPAVQWTEADQQLARALQCEIGSRQTGLSSNQGGVGGTLAPPTNGGGSDDIGDVSWNLPTVTLSYPANIPNLPGHNWANAIAMATPIAHKGAVAGAKAVAMTVLDLMTTPKLIADAKTYFNTVQQKDQKYDPVLTAADKPAIDLNTQLMAQMRPQMTKFYYDPTKYSSYLEQMGVPYPAPASPPPPAAK
jgi:aminobenzoyl-glutamate utilization protein B